MVRPQLSQLRNSLRLLAMVAHSQATVEKGTAETETAGTAGTAETGTGTAETAEAAEAGTGTGTAETGTRDRTPRAARSHSGFYWLPS